MPAKMSRVLRTLLEHRVVVPRHICWLAQQSLEKALKAILVFLALDFPRRHDLDALRNLVPQDWQVTTAHADLAARASSAPPEVSSPFFVPAFAAWPRRPSSAAAGGGEDGHAGRGERHQRERDQRAHARGALRDAAAALTETYGDAVFSFCLRMMRDCDVAADVRQKVFLEACRVSVALSR